MNSDFSKIKDYTHLRSCLKSVSEEIAARERGIISWKRLLLPFMRYLRNKIEGK